MERSIFLPVTNEVLALHLIAEPTTFLELLALIAVWLEQHDDYEAFINGMAAGLQADDRTLGVVLYAKDVVSRVLSNLEALEALLKSQPFTTVLEMEG